MEKQLAQLINPIKILKQVCFQKKIQKLIIIQKFPKNQRKKFTNKNNFLLQI